MISSNGNDIIIHPRRGRRERAIPRRVLLVVNPAEWSVARGMAIQAGAEERPFLHSQVLVDPAGRYCLAGPALGAPAAGLVLEKLISLGAQECWLISCCGSADPALAIGDRFLAQMAVIGEGVSRSYGACRRVIINSGMLAAGRRFLKHSGGEWREGVVWSTDAPYRERRSVIMKLRHRHGVAAIDMECSALAAIAAFRQIAFVALFVVSDEIWPPRWRSGFADPVFRRHSKRLLRDLLTLPATV